MRKLTLALAMLALLPTLAAAQSTYPQKRATLAYAWDLDGEAADDDQVVTSADLADSTTYALAAQPDVCRLIDLTTTDANSSVTVGTLTITGTDCLGYARVCALDFSVAAAQGSGVKTIPVTSGPANSSCYLASVTSVVTSALTGEAAGVDLVKVGYTSNSATGWPLYGKLREAGPSGEHAVDPFDAYPGPGLIRTLSANSRTLVPAVGAGFVGVVVGDLILVDVAGVTYDLVVTAKASDMSLTVHKAVTISRDSAWSYRKRYYSTDPTDDMSIPVQGLNVASCIWSVAATANTGGLQMILAGTSKGPGWPASGWVTQCRTAGVDCSGVTVSVPTGTTLSDTTEYLRNDWVRYTHLKMGFKYATGDDADAGAAESITASCTVGQ
jgi:hypothetical protein